MIVRSIKVSGWKCLVNEVTVGPFSDRLNILHAPNAKGKSTLLWALISGFFDSHHLGGREVEALRPWGRALVPTVTVEFEHDGKRYRLIKRFLDNPTAELLEEEGGSYLRVSEGRHADEDIREVLLGKPPGRGLSDTVNLGICQVLWAPQAEIALTDLSSDLVQNIQESLGQQVSGGPGAGSIEEAVVKLYRHYYTDKGSLKKGKDGSGIADLRKGVNADEGLLQELAEHAGKLEKVGMNVQGYREKRKQAALRMDGIKKELEKERERARVWTGLVAKRDKASQTLETRMAKYSALKQAVEAIKAARKELEESRGRIERGKKDLSAQSKVVANCRAEERAEKKCLEDARRKRKAVEKAEKEAGSLREYIAAKDGRIAADELIGKIRTAEEELRRHIDERSDLMAPDSRLLGRIRNAASKSEEARIRLDAAMITVEIEPEQSLTLDVVAAEETGKIKIKPGKTVEVKGAPEVVIDLSGIARISARGPEGEIEELREAAEKAEKKIEELTLEFGTSDLAELEKLNEKAKELDKKVAKAQTVLDVLVSDRPLEDVKRDQAKAATLEEEILEGHRDWKDELPEIEVVEAEARDKRDEVDREISDAEAAWELKKDTVESASNRQVELETEKGTLESQVESLEDKLAELEADGMDDKERADSVKELALGMDASQAALEEAEEKLKEYPDDPSEELGMLEKQIEANRDQVAEEQKKETEEETRLNQLAMEGSYSKLAEAEEEARANLEELEREELKAEAVKFLYRTVVSVRETSLEVVRKPVVDVATRLVRRIAGADQYGISMKGDFEPSVSTGISSVGDVEIGELSGGEQEQVYFAVRLALARLISRDERQLFVLDDVLAVTDDVRFSRILGIIDESLDRLQFLILTCHPEKYRAIEGARFIDLEESIAAGS